MTKGYMQCQGVDFEEVFTWVTILDTVRLILALATQHEWETAWRSFQHVLFYCWTWECWLVFGHWGFGPYDYQSIYFGSIKKLHGYELYDRRKRCLSTHSPHWYWYEPRDINHTIYFNEDVQKILLKLSKDISIHATLKKNEVSCYKFLVDFNLELLYFINVF